VTLDFWTESAAEAGVQPIHFLKNISNISGLFRFIASGAGTRALDCGRKAR